MQLAGYLAWLSIGVAGLVNAQAPLMIPYGTPAIDGTLLPFEWTAESRVRVARFYGTDQFADFYLQWDENNLYIAGMLEDYTVLEDGNNGAGGGDQWETRNDDSIEIYLHPSITDNATVLSTNSRILAFTPTGKFQRLDRGDGAGGTTGLETFRNTTNKIGDAAFLNRAIPTDWLCPAEQPTPITYPETIIQFKSTSDATHWRFEAALPWALVGTRMGTKITGNNCALGPGLFPAPLPVQEGTALKLNFKRVHDDNGGAQNVVTGGTFTNDDGVQSTNGTLLDEWTVYQGDVKVPAEWATFVLRKPTATSPAPGFSSINLTATPVEARRAFLHFSAPAHGVVAGQAATGYSIRYQEGVVGVTPEVWNSMKVFANAYKPAAPNSAERLEIIGLEPSKTYTVGIRAFDEVGRESVQILSTSFTTDAAATPFVTNNPTGRTLVTSDGKPFVLLGETVLMPWLPARGLYNGELCDEAPPIGDTTFNTLTAARTCIFTDEQGTSRTGRLRNYATEKLFFRCHFANGQSQDITDIDVTDILTNAGADPSDNCAFVANQAGTTVASIKAIEGEQVAVNYFAKLKASGMNVVSVFVESLDLHGTPIFFQNPDTGKVNPAALLFLDKLIDLAQKNDVRVLLRLYDTYYYKKKWAQTHWAKRHGKTNPDQFFDADLYDDHKNRLNALFSRVNSITNVMYRDDPTIFGWDLLNEVDNKERFNTASLAARQAWLQTMLAHARAAAPRHLAFFSFLTWDPKDDAHYRTPVAEIGESKFLGMDASTAFRLNGASLSAAHGYYAHIANPQAIPAASVVSGDFQRPIELARGISYSFYQVHDGRPVQDTESAPSPLFIKKYDEALKAGEQAFSKADDKEMFLNSIWLHFVSGGAGATMRWPITLDNASITITQLDDDWRAFLTIMKNTVGSINWRGDFLEVDKQRVNESQFIFVRHDDRTALAYLFNPSKQSISSINLPGLLPVSATVRVLNPRDGSKLSTQAVTNAQTFALNTPVKDHAVIIATGDFAQPVGMVLPQTDGSFLLKIGAVEVAGAGRFEAIIHINSTITSFTLDAALTPTAAPYAQPAVFAADTANPSVFKLTIPGVAVPGSPTLIGNVVLQYKGGVDFSFLGMQSPK